MRAADTVDEQQQRAVRLVVAQQALMHAYARVICRDAALAEDAAQEAALAVIAQAARLPPPEAEIPWLKRVVRHKALHQLRRHGRQQPLDANSLEDLGEAIEPALETLEPMRRAMGACLEELSDGARRLLDQRYRAARPVAELAREAGLGVEGIYSRIKRIRDTLRRCVEQRMGREPA